MRRLVGVLGALIARGANVGVEDSLKRTAIFYTVNSVFDDRMLVMLLEAGAPLEHVGRRDWCRAASGSTAVIQALLNRGVVVSELRYSRKPGYRDRDGDGSPLHLAASLKRERAVLSMLVHACGVDLEARNFTGATCTHRAVACGNVDALRWFIDAGADIDARDTRGAPPLHAVIDYECAVALLAAGADVNLCDSQGSNAAFAVANHSACAAMPALVACGADLDVVNNDGDTARLVLTRRNQIVDAALVDAARRDIGKARLDFVRFRALQVCIGLQSLMLDALQLCEILRHACGCAAALIPFH